VQEMQRTRVEAPASLFELGDRAVFAPAIPSDFQLVQHSKWLKSSSGLRYKFETWTKNISG